MKKNLLFILSLLSLLLPVIPALSQGSDCSEIFFSEYVEGSGNNKALEIYNPTDQVIDLSYYFVVRLKNGAGWDFSGGVTQLQGFLPDHSVFILVNGQTEDVDLGGGNISPKCDPALQELASQYPHQMDHGYPAPTYMNGNDAIALLKSDTKDVNNAVAVDLIGQFGLGNAIAEEYGWSNIKDTTVSYNVHLSDSSVIVTKGKVINYIVQAHDTSGTHFGPFWLAWTKDHTLVRKRTVKKGVTQNPDPFVVSAEWDTVPGGKDVWDSLGTHTCDCNTTGVQDIPNVLSQVYIYPNPVTNHQFEVIAGKGILGVSVTNILGQTIAQIPRTPWTRHRVIVTLPGDLSPGVYLVRVKTDDEREAIQKILVK